MPGAARQTDVHYNPSDVCGCKHCPHEVYGEMIWVSDDTFMNAMGAGRGSQIDGGTHSYCCGPQTWRTMMGSPNTFIDTFPAVRLGDRTICCGGYGTIITASSDVFING